MAGLERVEGWSEEVYLRTLGTVGRILSRSETQVGSAELLEGARVTAGAGWAGEMLKPELGPWGAGEGNPQTCGQAVATG